MKNTETKKWFISKECVYANFTYKNEYNFNLEINEFRKDHWATVEAKVTCHPYEAKCTVDIKGLPFSVDF